MKVFGGGGRKIWKNKRKIEVFGREGKTILKNLRENQKNNRFATLLVVWSSSFEKPTN